MNVKKEESATMSEELETLKRIIKTYEERGIIHYSDIDIIETAFKDYEELLKKHKDLERKYYIETLSIDYKKLKALEIIKEKEVDTLLLFRCFEFDNLYGYSHFEMYNQELYTQNITQEEYDLLKEVLK